MDLVNSQKMFTKVDNLRDSGSAPRVGRRVWVSKMARQELIAGVDRIRELGMRDRPKRRRGVWSHCKEQYNLPSRRYLRLDQSAAEGYRAVRNDSQRQISRALSVHLGQRDARIVWTPLFASNSNGTQSSFATNDACLQDRQTCETAGGPRARSARRFS